MADSPSASLRGIAAMQPDAYRTLLDNMSEGVSLSDEDGCIIYTNPAEDRMFGYDPGELLGQHVTVQNAYSPDENARIVAAVIPDLKRSGTWRGEWLNKRKDGSVFTTTSRINAVDIGGRPHWLCVQEDTTEARAAEQALQEQTAILGQLAEGVIVADAAGRLTYVNDSAVRLHGVRQLGINPEHYSDTYHLYTEDGRPYPSLELPLSRALRGETVENARWRIRRPDGTTILAIGSARPLLDPRGRQIGAVLTLRDDTARDAAERELRENEARLRALTDNLPGGMVYQITTGRDGADRKFLYVSASHQQLTGIPAEAVLEDPTIPYQLIHPDDRAVLVEAEATAIRDRQPFDVQVRFRRADGAERWCRILSASREQPDGSLLWEGLQIDVTDRVKAEQALLHLNATLEERVLERTAERNLLATLVETTDVLVLAADLDYNILAINQANVAEFERVYGVRPRTGDNMLALLADKPEHQAEVREGWSRALAGQEMTVVEDYGDPDRARPYYAISFRVLRDDQGKQIGAYQFVTDVTERLRAEAKLIETEEALRQSQKMEAMGQLTGGVAHDFNNLLTPIIGLLDMLIRRGIGSEREQRLIGGAMQSAERAKTLVQRLLAFARRQPLQPTAVDLRRLLDGLGDLLASTLGPRIELRTAAADGLPLARADANQLDMAILNLAVNARDAMPNGGQLTISVTSQTSDECLHAVLEPGTYLKITVADTGVGMDEQTLRRAIEPFFSTKGIGKGTGLGLSMVHGLAAQLGGALTLSSRSGQGTTVELWLPVSTGRLSEVEARPSATQPLLSRRVVLLVDDEELVRMSTAAMLGDLGYDVVEASSGEEARTLLQQGLEPDLLVTDHLMPGINGVDLAREARTTAPNLPILIVSGYAEVDGLASDLPRLTKPFRHDELAEQLAQLLSTGTAKVAAPAG